MIQSLYNNWKQTLLPFKIGDSLVDESFLEICNTYGFTKRDYHNLSHIHDLIKKAEATKSNNYNSTDLYLSIWFHDIIYNVFDKKNEVKSADYAQGFIEQYISNAALSKRVYKMIVSTSNHMNRKHISDATWHLFLDLDLSILGSSREKYLNYSKSIRKEYKKIPKWLYNKNRIKILQNLISTEKIYYSKEFKAIEVQARENIRYELQLLNKNR